MLPFFILIGSFCINFSNAGGGGEKVLWEMQRIICEKYPHRKVVVYMSEQESIDKILEKTKVSKLIEFKAIFGIEISENVEFVKLKLGALTKPNLYPIFTLLGQSFGGLLLAFEAITKFIPEVMIGIANIM